MNSKKKWDDIYQGSSNKSKDFFQFSQDELSWVLDHFPQANTVLDIGCGRGELLAQLEERGLATEGIDLSSVAMNEAKINCGAALHTGCFEKYSFAPGAVFDLIFIKFVLAYIVKKDDFFKKVVQLLREGGGCVIITPVIEFSNNPSDSVPEIFVERKVLDMLLSTYFTVQVEKKMYEEKEKSLSIFILHKK
ncbi:MAG: class I SAM-dependent methyltransferase [Candidatus Paceibacterota bacterium]